MLLMGANTASTLREKTEAQRCYATFPKSHSHQKSVEIQPRCSELWSHERCISIFSFPDGHGGRDKCSGGGGDADGGGGGIDGGGGDGGVGGMWRRWFWRWIWWWVCLLEGLEVL